MNKLFVTGDLHGSLKSVEQLKQFCAYNNTDHNDIIVLLGDVGANYHLNEYDIDFKSALASLPITILCVHGNHEARPETIPTYILKYSSLIDGECWVEPNYPNILFPKDGMVTIFGKKCLILGGAYSVDKWYRLMNGLTWFPDEQMSISEQNRILSLLDSENEFEYIFSHTCPIAFEPTHLFLNFIDQNSVDKTMEYFLQKVYNKISFNKWFCGHYHSDEENGKIQIVFNLIHRLK